MLINSPNISGSLTVTGNSVISGSLTVLGSITGAITGSATSASYVEYTNVANKPTLVSGSGQISFNGITDKPTLVSGSEQISFNGITDKPTLVSGSSQITYSGLTGIPAGIVSGSAQVTALGFASTGSSNTFQASQIITGSLFITQNLVVAGSSSIQYISSSVLDIADNIITVNAFNPGVRFGGLAVIDSGSSPQVSGSLLFDSIKDQWIFVHQNQSVVTSSVVLMGPETYNDLGNESYISANRLPKGSGVEHLRDSNITDTGTVVSVNSNTVVTGSFTVVTGSVVELQVTNLGVNIGSALTDSHIISGSLRVNPNGLFVSGSGNVGVNTTTPSERLSVVGAGLFGSHGAGSYSLAISNNDQSNVRLRITNAGSGGQAFSIVGGNPGASNAGLAIYDETNAATRLYISSTGIATFTGQTVAANGSVNIESADPAIRFRYTGGTTNARIYEWRAVAAGGVNDIMQLRLWNDAQSSATTLFTVSPTGAGIFSSTVTATRGFFSSNAASDSTTGLLANATTNDSSTYAAIFGSLNAGYRMVVRADGNVGIGNTSPQGLLQIGANALSNNADASNAFNLKQTSTTAATGIYLERSGERKGYYMYMGGSLDSLTFQRNNAGTKADVMSLTRDGNVGIGTDSPSAKLNTNLSVEGALLAYLVNTSATFNAGANIAVTHNSSTLGTNTAAGILLANNDNSNNAISPLIAFSAKSQSTSYNHTYAAIYGQKRASGADTNWNTGDLIIATGNATGPIERLRVLAAGGLTFNGDTAAANALNDYEEGSWTPSLQNATISYSERSGSYVKIGNYVFVRWGFRISSISGQSGTVTISGLPFTAVSWGSYQEPNISISTGNLATTDNAQRARLYKGGGDTSLYGRIANNGDTTWATSDLQNGSWIIGEIFYNV